MKNKYLQDQGIVIDNYVIYTKYCIQTLKKKRSKNLEEIRRLEQLIQEKEKSYSASKRTYDEKRGIMIKLKKKQRKYETDYQKAQEELNQYSLSNHGIRQKELGETIVSAREYLKFIDLFSSMIFEKKIKIGNAFHMFIQFYEVKNNQSFEELDEPASLGIELIHFIKQYYMIKKNMKRFYYKKETEYQYETQQERLECVRLYYQEMLQNAIKLFDQNDEKLKNLQQKSITSFQKNCTFQTYVGSVIESVDPLLNNFKTILSQQKEEMKNLKSRIKLLCITNQEDMKKIEQLKNSLHSYYDNTQISENDYQKQRTA